MIEGDVLLLQHMEINQAAYVGSFPSEAKAPREGMPEYAFIGRSNVGKSSLINMLCGRKEIAHTSKKHAKTQLLHYYLIDKSWYIVDLPGYGYAKISKKKRAEWKRMIDGYLIKRNTLQCAFVLIDSNVAPQKLDVEFINWLGEKQIPFVLVFTKADRLKPEILEENLEKIREEFKKYWHELPQQFITSSLDRSGRQEILDFIASVNERM